MPSMTPQSLTDISVEWMAEALGVALDAIEVSRIAEGHGFMGQLARVTLHSSDPEAPSSVIVKLPTSDPGGHAIGEMMRVWEREHCFYRDIAPQLNIRVPTAFVNIADPPCLVLEDLAPAQPGELSPALLDRAANQLRRAFEPVHGGLGNAPKFPRPIDLRLLLRIHKRFGQLDALEMVKRFSTWVSPVGE